MSHKTLLQKVMHSCKELYLQGNKSFDKVEVAKKFIELWYYTKEIDIVRAMDRRMNDLVMIWLLSVKFLEKNNYYLTDHWRRVKTDKIHLWVTLVIRDNKESDVCKKASPDKIKKVRAESEVKSENKVFNMAILNEAQEKLLQNEEPTHIRTSEWKLTIEEYENKLSEEKNTELINTNKWTPKHSLREHIKSLFF